MPLGRLSRASPPIAILLVLCTLLAVCSSSSLMPYASRCIMERVLPQTILTSPWPPSTEMICWWSRCGNRTNCFPSHFFGLWVSGHVSVATASMFCQGGPFRVPLTEHTELWQTEVDPETGAEKRFPHSL